MHHDVLLPGQSKQTPRRDHPYISCFRYYTKGTWAGFPKPETLKTRTFLLPQNGKTSACQKNGPLATSLPRACQALATSLPSHWPPRAKTLNGPTPCHAACHATAHPPKPSRSSHCRKPPSTRAQPCRLPCHCFVQDGTFSCPQVCPPRRSPRVCEEALLSYGAPVQCLASVQSTCYPTLPQPATFLSYNFKC